MNATLPTANRLVPPTAGASRRAARRLVAAAALLLAVAGAQGVKEERHPEFGKAMLAMAEQLEVQLDDAQSVMIGPFVGPGEQKHPAIVQALSDLLKQRGKTKAVVVNELGQDVWRAQGKVSHGKDPRSGLFCGNIDCRLTNAAGNDVYVMVRKIINAEEDVLALAPATVDLAAVAAAPANGESKTELRADAIQQALAKASFTLGSQPSVVRASNASPYGVEIIAFDARGNQVAMPVRSDNGQACVDLKPGQAYAVRVWNDSPYDAGVQLSIDGLNSLALSQEAGYRQAGRWVVPAGKQGIIRGWHDIGNNLKQFVVGRYGDAPAAQLGQPDKAGMISATFCASYFGNPPPDERSFGGVPKGLYATVVGPPVQQRIDPVACVFGVVRAAVAVKYVTHDQGDLPQQ